MSESRLPTVITGFKEHWSLTFEEFLQQLNDTKNYESLAERLAYRPEDLEKCHQLVDHVKNKNQIEDQNDHHLQCIIGTYY